MICLDNSEWMRNGDFTPTRMKAQRDAVNILCTRHLSANPENTVGIMTMAGPRCTIHATQCSDNPRLHRSIALNNTPVGGTCRVVRAIKIARLALKNRSNQKGEARIVVFVGSPLKETVKEFKKIGNDLKKNSCGISVVMLGEFGDNKEKLETLVNAARKEEGQQCDLIIVPPGVKPLEVVRSSPLCNTGYQGGSGSAAGASAGAAGAAGGAAGGGGGGGGGEDDLERALRLSLLESQGAAGGGGGGDVAPEAMTEEEQIRRAIELSMMGAPAPAPAPESDNATGGASEPDADDAEVDEDDLLLQQALAMSNAEADGNEAGGSSEDGDDDDVTAALLASMRDIEDDGDNESGDAGAGASAESAAPALPEASSGADDAAFSDPDYIRNLLSTIPGASMEDPLIKAALEEARKYQGNDGENKDNDDKKDDGGKK